MVEGVGKIRHWDKAESEAHPSESLLDCKFHEDKDGPVPVAVAEIPRTVPGMPHTFMISR